MLDGLCGALEERGRVCGPEGLPGSFCAPVYTAVLLVTGSRLPSARVLAALPLWTRKWWQGPRLVRCVAHAPAPAGFSPALVCV